MPLTEGQQTAIGQMREKHPTYILKGYAGTGKTYLLEEFIETMEEEERIVITAPTNKALAVASGDHTIHSYLGLKLERKKNKYILKQVERNVKAESKDIVVIDEASMITTEILHFIQDAQEELNLKLIFVGDPAQLPPVGEDVSPVWNLPAPTYTLTEIVRQAADSNIIKLATKVRTKNWKLEDIEKLTNNKDIFTSNSMNLEEFFDLYTETDTSDPFVVKSTSPQLIAFRNLTVDRMNNWARNKIMQDPTEPYLPGERVYIRSCNQSRHIALKMW